MSIISIKNLVHRFDKRNDAGDVVGHTVAIDNLSLEVNKGEFIAILGHNGSGKSTLAKHINALLFPSEGAVYVLDNNTLDQKKILDIRKSAGMVFQNPDNQIIATIVEEDVAFGPENLGVETHEIRDRVDLALKTVRMTKHAKKSPNKLSGGQKQRVAIAGVLAMKPDCILLDEPTAMLDPIGRKEVIDTVKKLNKEEGLTVILVTHFMEEAIRADRVIVMEKGRIVKNGTPEEVFQDVPEMKKLGLDVPQVTEVAYLLGEKGKKLGKVLSIEDFVREYKPDGEIRNFSVEEKVEDDKKLILELKNLEFTYGEGTVFASKALNDISLKIYENEFIALIGQTGSGKSTLIQHLNALEKPQKGLVLYNGKNIWDDSFDRRKLRGEVSLAFQYPDHQLFEMTIEKDVAFGPTNLGLSKEEIDERVAWALGLVGIDKEKWGLSPFDLSGGQKKRVAIAGVLAMKPRVLILDEPTAGLDPRGRDEILGSIKRIQQETKITVVLVSHSMEEVAEYATRILVLSDGKIIKDGKPCDVFEDEELLESVSLSVPQVKRLAHRLNEKGLGLSKQILRPAELAEALMEK